MDFDGNYLCRGSVDVSRLAEAVAGLSEGDWLEDRYRQETFKAHRDTNTLSLLFDEDFRHTTPTQGKQYDRFEHVINPIQEAIATHFRGAGWTIRLLLVRLRAGGIIPPHVDSGFSLSNSHRLHIPVVTNEGAGFSVGGEERRMWPGEVVEINNQRQHTAWNRGITGRVHLILDWARPLPA